MSLRHSSNSIPISDHPPSDSEESIPNRSVRFDPEGLPDSDGARRPLLRKPQPCVRSSSNPRDELRNFRSLLRWMCLDHTSTWRAAISWAVFFGAALAVPAVSHFVLSYDSKRRRFDAVVQTSLTALSALSFLCMWAFTSRYGLKRFLFLDKLCMESEKVRLGCPHELNKSLKLLSIFVLPCLAAETAYKIWWYQKGAGRIPFLGNQVASDTVTCVVELFSWLYRTSVFFLVCVLFRLICRLQVLRLHGFAPAFREESDVAPILAEHLRMRRHLRAISHRFRLFIVSCLFIVTFSLLASLLLTTKSSSDVNIFNTGELALSSITIVSGLFLCLRSAAKITHKAHAITSHAAKWHICATVESFGSDPETPGMSPRVHPEEVSDDEEVSCDDDDDDDDDALEGSLKLHLYANTISFQKRQALVTYLENNKAGITIFGFMLDRTWLHTIFGVELTLVLWLLQKTIGIS